MKAEPVGVVVGIDPTPSPDQTVLVVVGARPLVLSPLELRALFGRHEVVVLPDGRQRDTFTVDDAAAALRALREYRPTLYAAEPDGVRLVPRCRWRRPYRQPKSWRRHIRRLKARGRALQAP